MNIYIVIFIIIIILWIFLIFKYKKSYKLSSSKKAFFNSHLQKIISYNSYKWQIIDLDKLYHKILLEVWYRWTFWEILKKEPSEIENITNMWTT